MILNRTCLFSVCIAVSMEDSISFEGYVIKRVYSQRVEGPARLLTCKHCEPMSLRWHEDALFLLLALSWFSSLHRIDALQKAIVRAAVGISFILSKWPEWFCKTLDFSTPVRWGFSAPDRSRIFGSWLQAPHHSGHSQTSNTLLRTETDLIP